MFKSIGLIKKEDNEEGTTLNTRENDARARQVESQIEAGGSEMENIADTPNNNDAAADSCAENTFQEKSQLTKKRKVEFLKENMPCDPSLSVEFNNREDNSVNKTPRVSEKWVVNQTKTQTDGQKRFAKNLSNWSCGVCKKSFSNKFSFEVHYNRHDDPNWVYCKKCRKFVKQINNDKHVRSHEDPNLECDICFKVFSTLKNLEMHKPIHSKIFKFKCKYCLKKFHQKGNMKIHEKKYHMEI